MANLKVGRVWITVLPRMGDWVRDAACQNASPDLFFPPQYGFAEIGVARRLCWGCPVLQECRDWGLRYEEFGVWGGLTENERRNERRRLGISLVKESEMV